MDVRSPSKKVMVLLLKFSEMFFCAINVTFSFVPLTTTQKSSTVRFWERRRQPSSAEWKSYLRHRYSVTGHQKQSHWLPCWLISATGVSAFQAPAFTQNSHTDVPDASIFLCICNVFILHLLLFYFIFHVHVLDSWFMYYVTVTTWLNTATGIVLQVDG